MNVMDRLGKQEIVDNLRAEIEGSPSVIVASGAGLNAVTMTDLRKKLRDAGAKYRVVKNTLARLALKDTRYENLSESLVGPTALVFHPEDAVAPAKVLVDFQKDVKTLQLRAGWLNGSILDTSGVEALSKMPGKDELRAKLLSVMTAAPTNFVRVLAAGPTSFLNVLNARKDAIS